MIMRHPFVVFSLTSMLLFALTYCTNDAPSGLSTDSDLDTGSEVTTDQGADPDTLQDPTDPSIDPAPDLTDALTDTDPVEEPIEDPIFDPSQDPDLPPDIPDMSNQDTDGDGILDQHEGYCWTNTDGDELVDCEDLDSDDDGIPDSVEAGDDDPMTPPIDTNGDNEPDFQDLDSDGDGIFDEVEGTDDPDEDGDGNWIDRDSDGDYLSDTLEGTNDYDGDFIPDYLDPDSDNDYIPDWLEGVDNTDGDALPDRFDDDSDDDGVSDLIESGDTDLWTMPVNTDHDSYYDFRDLDSDGDGLGDNLELGCPDSTSRIDEDSDDDTYSDMAEVAVGSDPCNAADDVYDHVEFFFILPPDEEVVSSGDSAMEFGTDLVQMDVHFNMDTTGSMGDEIDSLQEGLISISNQLRTRITDTWFGLSSFRDFYYSGQSYGSSGDWPYRLEQRVTGNLTLVQDAIDDLSHGGGADIPESGLESLYQIATGAGLTVSGCAACAIAAFSGGSGYFSGVGFRDGSLPVIVVHITDAVSHNGYGSEYVFSAHHQTDTVAALNAHDIKVIGVVSDANSPRSEMIEIATATNTVVPICAFDGSRPAGCSAAQCCTGINGAGTAPVGGECPLVFTVDSYGNGLGSTVVDAIEFLANTTTLVVTAELIGYDYHVAGDPPQDLNSSCFITAITPDHYESSTTCGPTPSIVGDHFEDVTAGSRVFFTVTAENDDCFDPIDEPMLFEATINIWGNETTLLDTLDVTIIIPPTDPGGPKNH